MNADEIMVVDVTIREGMQYFGMMFSLDERVRLLEFQARLGVDISQVAYPPAHISEQESLRHLHHVARENRWHVRVAGLCRALGEDIRPLVAPALDVYSLHTSITPEMLHNRDWELIFSDVRESIALIRSAAPQALIEISLLDISKTDPPLLEKMVDYLVDPLAVDVIVLPDTSGVMPPNGVMETVQKIVARTCHTPTQIGIHCHNDLGMASANTVMGVVAGAQIIHVSALGIGERNGIGDMYTVAKCLKDQGYRLRLPLEESEWFAQYYAYVDELVRRQLHIALLTPNTPFFGKAVACHVAGAHGLGTFGVSTQADFQLNVLCGKHLVKRYLENHHIAHDPATLPALVAQIKDRSVALGRALEKDEVLALVRTV